MRSPLVALIAAVTLFAPAARAADLTIAVDAREAPRRILHVRETVVAQPGTMALSYPKWLPGEHGPTGPNTDIAGLVIRAAGRTLEWTRDPVDMNTVRFDVPPGAATVEAAFDFMMDGATHGYTAAAGATENLVLMSWNEVSLYPAGRKSDTITCDASLTLPAGWKHATALEPAPPAGAELRFATCNYTTLVDSPVLAGAHFRVIDLTPGEPVAHRLDLACDSEAGLALPDASIAAMRRLPKEAYALFGTRHYRHYDFLMTLSDHTAHFGLEHHQSSDDRSFERAWVDDDLRRNNSNLLSHEFTHSWNGKFRRPAGLATGDYFTPMQGELLWVYEGLTQYIGFVLSGRSGLRTPAESREALARAEAGIEASRGRTWRPLVDTAVEAQLLYDARGAWEHWRRGTDFYDEGLLIWLEADVTIRRLSNGQRSLDDFCKRFHGGPNNGPEVKPYTFDDVVAALNAVQPYDWASFLRERIDKVQPHAPTGGITQGGWRMAWSDTAGPMFRAHEEGSKDVEEAYSIGITLDRETGEVMDVVPGSAADRAGVSPEMSLLGVNGRKWNKDVLHDAIAATRKGAPLELLLENKEFYRTAKLDYHDGLRYPVVVRDPAVHDWLDEILAPHAK